ncbi:MAG TPA: hypothetical protein VFW65_08895 [Pseudonocardiaceae bacterium]|nr:hypothetical protein [Pseudonocardiaceae bacterium]
MDDQTKVTTAVLAGYLLGRTKQGKRALRLALWLNGGGGGLASNLAQQAKTGLVANPALAALLAQLRGPLADAARKAVTSAVETRANSLADALQNRTAALSLPGGQKVGDIIDAGGNDDEEPEPDEDEAPPPRQRRSRSESASRTTRQSKADTGQQPRRRTKAATEKTSRTKRDASNTTTAKREPAKRTTKARQSGSRSGTQSGSRSSGSRSGTQSGGTRRRASTR